MMSLDSWEAEGLCPLKITVVGDGFVGKTSLLTAYTDPSIDIKHERPTVSGTYFKVLTVDGIKFDLSLWDTSGMDGYDRLRTSTYPKTDCIILCYAIDSHASYENVYHKWIKEIRYHWTTAPVLLLATKTDRMVEVPNPVTEKEGQKLKSWINASGFIQCSAKTRDNIDEVFIECVRAVMRPKTKGSPCTIV